MTMPWLKDWPSGAGSGRVGPGRVRPARAEWGRKRVKNA